MTPYEQIDKLLQAARIAELEKRNFSQGLRLAAYQLAINSIDDWFEYANESKADREKIHKILAHLTQDLKLTTTPAGYNRDSDEALGKSLAVYDAPADGKAAQKKHATALIAVAAL